MRYIQNLIPTPLAATKEILENKTLLTQMILDPTHKLIQDRIPLTAYQLMELEKVTQLMVYQLHYRRAQNLGYRH